MSGIHRRAGSFFKAPLTGGILCGTAAAALLASAGVAYSGPCTAQIAALEQQVRASPAGGEQLPFGLLALHFRGRAFGHGPDSAEEM